MWCDTVHWQLNFVNLKVDFSTMEIVTSGDTLLIYDHDQCEDAAAWDDILEAVKIEVDTDGTMKFTISYSLHVLEDQTSSIYQFEYTGPPLATAEMLTLDAEGAVKIDTVNNDDFKQQIEFLKHPPILNKI